MSLLLLLYHVLVWLHAPHHLSNVTNVHTLVDHGCPLQQDVGSFGHTPVTDKCSKLPVKHRVAVIASPCTFQAVTVKCCTEQTVVACPAVGAEHRGATGPAGPEGGSANSQCSGAPPSFCAWPSTCCTDQRS